jgi:uncharacterized protein YjeT (DUF2065 family)
MNKTRLSLYYLATYLTVGGIGFILLPQTMLTLFFSNGTYSDIMVRFNGVLLLSIGIFVIQLIRHQVSELYGTTLIVRTIILIALVALYFISRDPLMISLSVIVGLGFVLTLTSYILDRKTVIRV